MFKKNKNNGISKKDKKKMYKATKEFMIKSNTEELKKSREKLLNEEVLNNMDYDQEIRKHKEAIDDL